MRVFVPATFDMLGALARDGKMPARSGIGFALTPALREFYTAGDDEEMSYAAFLEAARASLRLLGIGDEERFPHRRVVVSVDLDDGAVTPEPDKGESVVRLDSPVISVDDLAAIHVDDGE